MGCSVIFGGVPNMFFLVSKIGKLETGHLPGMIQDIAFHKKMEKYQYELILF